MSIIQKAEVVKHMLVVDGKQVDYKPSPNVGGPYTPIFLVYHYTADTAPEQTINWFTKKESKVSAHLLIDREGNITQLVPFSLKAQHAGESEWEGYKNLNSYSIGIELTNAGLLIKDGKKYLTLNREHEVQDVTIVNGFAYQPYTPIQLQVLKVVSDAIVQRYSLKEVIGHNDIAPKRKIDPGPAFPWKFFKTENLMSAKKITDSNVNLRIDPSTDFKPIQVIPENTQVVELGFEKNGFTYVKLIDSLKGWISKEHLK